jgi:hypothetical protein
MGWSAASGQLGYKGALRRRPNANIYDRHGSWQDGVHLTGLNARGEVVARKKCFRTQVVLYSKCSGRLDRHRSMREAHFLDRALRGRGHGVRIIPVQYAKRYVKVNNRDYIDAEAIVEAVERPTMPFVPMKTEDQQDLQSLHRVAHNAADPHRSRGLDDDGTYDEVPKLQGTRKLVRRS